MLDKTQHLPVFAALHPFSNRRHDRIATAGGTLCDILTEVDMQILLEPDLNVHLFVDDRKIERDAWGLTIPAAGQSVAVRVAPAGGGSGKNVLRGVMLIAVMALSIYSGGLASAAYGPYAGAAAGAGVGIAGSLAVNALVPYVPADPGGGLGTTSGALNLPVTGIRNTANLYGPIPRIFGTHKLYPLLAAEPYTESAGVDSYLRMLFCVGMGEYDLTDHKIGETALTSYSDYDISEGYYDELDEIYPYDVHEDSLSIEVTNASGWNQQTTINGISEIQVDMTFPDGIWEVTDGGTKRNTTVVFELDYAVKDSGSWNNFPDAPNLVSGVWTMWGNSQKRWTRTFRVTGLTPGEYDVRIRRTTSDSMPGGLDAINNDCWWTAMRAFTYSDPFALDGVTLIALRIKANGILNGVIDQFNVVASAKIPAWNGAAWTANAATRSPAWAFAEVLRGAANLCPVADSKINGGDLLTWDTACTTAEYYFDAVIDNKTTVFELLRKIAAAGRASFGIVDNQYTVIRDTTQSTARQHFSPRNSWGFSGHKAFLDLPHALRCRFINSTAEYRADEIIVTDDGYYYDPDTSETTWAGTTAYALLDFVAPTTPNGYLYQCITAGTSGAGEPSWPTTIRGTVSDGTVTWMCELIATEFETMDFWGVTTADHVWKLARYNIAVARLRPETYQLYTDVEWVVCVRGDLVRLTHDVLLVGLGQARIKAIDGLDVTMDASITMDEVSSYGAQIRKADGTMLDTTIATDAGEQTIVTLGSVTGAAVGDMIFYGETDAESIDCLVSRIEPGPDMSARLTLIPYSAGVLTADSTQIPDWDPVITIPPPDNREPPTPTIESVTLTASAAIQNNTNVIVLTATIDFTISTIDPSDLMPASFQGQWRTVGEDDADPPNAVYSPWYFVDNIPLDQRYFDVIVEDGETYDFRVRAVSLYGLTSAWDTESDYTVDYAPNVPNDITTLALVGGGSTWPGRDCQLVWDEPTDLWRIEKYKLNIYTTTPLTLVRTKYPLVGELTASYTFDENYEDQSGSPTGSLTFRIWPVDASGTTSTNYDELVVTHTAPVAVTSLVGTAFRGGALFTWTHTKTDDFSVFWISIQVEDDEVSWHVQTQNYFARTLTDAEVTEHGADATIHINVYVRDIFSIVSAGSSTSTDAGVLFVQPTDIDDFPSLLSDLYLVPVIVGLTMTDNSPGAGQIAWNAHSLWYDGTEYEISAGDTSNTYVYFKDLATTYVESDNHPADSGGEADWDETEDFIIMVNDGGTAIAAWKAIANLVVGSAYIKSAAIQDVHVDTLSGTKITAGTITLTGLDSDVQYRMGATYNLVKNGEFRKDSDGETTPEDWDTTINGTPTQRKVWAPTPVATYGAPWDMNNALVYYANCDDASEYVQLTSADYIPIDEDKDYCLSCWVRGTSGTRRFYLGLQYYDSDYLALSPASQHMAAYDYSPTTSWHQVDGIVYNSASGETYKFPAGCCYVKIICYPQYLAVGANLVSRIAFVEGHAAQRGITVIDGGNIYTGTVTADQIAANTITASEIAASTITATELAANSVTASEIAANAVTASEINGAGFGTLTITSGKIAINTTDALEIQSGGNVLVKAGSDIVFESTSGNAGQIQFDGQNRTFYMGVDYDNDNFCIYPDTDNNGNLRIGYDYSGVIKDFAAVQIRANANLILYGGSDPALIDIDNDINITGDVLPTSDSTYTLGDATHRWSDVFTDQIDVESDPGAGDVWVGGFTNTRSASAPRGVFIYHPNYSGAAGYYLHCSNSGGDDLYIQGDGDCYNANGTYGTISDESLKENITDATGKLDDLLKLQVRNFNLKQAPDLKQIGLIAQELEPIFPALVTENEQGLKQIKASVLVPMLIKAIQELNEKVDIGLTQRRNVATKKKET